MRPIVALALLVLAGLALAGCGSSKRVTTASTVTSGKPPAPFGAVVVTGTTTVGSVEPGTVVVCKGGQPRTTVPEHPGQVNVGYGVVTATGKRPKSSGNLQLTRSASGVVTVSCSR